MGTGIGLTPTVHFGNLGKELIVLDLEVVGPPAVLPRLGSAEELALLLDNTVGKFGGEARLLGLALFLLPGHHLLKFLLQLLFEGGLKASSVLVQISLLGHVAHGGVDSLDATVKAGNARRQSCHLSLGSRSPETALFPVEYHVAMHIIGRLEVGIGCRLKLGPLQLSLILRKLELLQPFFQLLDSSVSLCFVREGDDFLLDDTKKLLPPAKC